MESTKRYSLEEFAARHRADFDAHEPRPELWEALAHQLAADAEPAAPAPHLHKTPAAALPLGPAKHPRRWHLLQVACAVLVLLGTAVLGGIWKARETGNAATAQTSPTDPRGYWTTDAQVAAETGPASNARLDTAVRGMERYYTTQLADRQAQLQQLAPAGQEEWMQELVNLDSSYQQLRRELPQHPQPEAVLTAMNRNMQIRLDILDRQLELHGGNRYPADETASALGSEYSLANSRMTASGRYYRAH